MKPVCRNPVTRSRIPSLLLFCALSMVACDKQEDTDTSVSGNTDTAAVNEQADKTQNSLDNLVMDAKKNANNSNNLDGENTATSAAAPIARTPVIMCDDQLALTQLIQTVRASIYNQSQNMLEHYIDRTDMAAEAANTHASVSAMLVDMAKPKQISAANSNGLITCNASLSLTLPTKDIYRAQDVYRALDGDSLNKRLQAQKVSMTNNMLVTNTFAYVVGIQSGQTVTRMVGQPPILSAVADIIAKSQFKAAVDATQPKANNEPNGDAEVNKANKTNKVPIERPAQPAQSAQPTQPPSPARVTNPDEVNDSETLPAVKQSETADKPATPRTLSKPSTNKELKGDASANTTKTQRSGSDAARQSQDTAMVITQDDATY